MAATKLHSACTIVERRTMNRVFPDGRAVLRQLFKTVELQEAAFKDVVVLYSSRVDPRKKGDGGAGPTIEEDRVSWRAGEGDTSWSGLQHRCCTQAALARQIHIKHFKNIPLADLEMVMPDKVAKAAWMG